jgi:hypothetical protein
MRLSFDVASRAHVGQRSGGAKLAPVAARTRLAAAALEARLIV